VADTGLGTRRTGPPPWAVLLGFGALVRSAIPRPLLAAVTGVVAGVGVLTSVVALAVGL
jgi:hypothetical protein